MRSALIETSRDAFLRGLRLCAAISAFGSIGLAILAAASFRGVQPAAERVAAKDGGVAA